MLRLLLLVLGFLLSLLSFFPAPALWIWYLAILATEYSWIGALLVMALGFWPSGGRRLAIYRRGLAGLTAVLFMIPLWQAHQISQRLPEELGEAFGPAHFSQAAVHRPYAPGRSMNMFARIPSPQTMTYDSSNGLVLDYYRPSSSYSGPRPWVMAVHGGSWKGGDRRQIQGLYADLVAQGYGVLAIDYRLAPAHRFPASRTDLRKALRFVKDSAAKMGLDSARFFLLGRSAGAQIALLEAYAGQFSGLRGVVGFYGPADMVWGYKHPARIYNSVEVLETYLGAPLSQIPELYDQSSPIHFVGRSSPPSLLIHGEKDVLVAWEHSVRLGQALEEAQVPWYLLSLPWATHGADFAYQGPFYQLSTYAIRYFFDRYSQPQ